MKNKKAIVNKNNSMLSLKAQAPLYDSQIFYMLQAFFFY